MWLILSVAFQLLERAHYRITVNASVHSHNGLKSSIHKTAGKLWYWYYGWLDFSEWANSLSPAHQHFYEIQSGHNCNSQSAFWFSTFSKLCVISSSVMSSDAISLICLIVCSSESIPQVLPTSASFTALSSWNTTTGTHLQQTTHQLIVKCSSKEIIKPVTALYISKNFVSKVLQSLWL